MSARSASPTTNLALWGRGPQRRPPAAGLVRPGSDSRVAAAAPRGRDATPTGQPGRLASLRRPGAWTHQREVVDDMLLLQHLQPQELDLLLVPRQAQVVQGGVALQRRLRGQLLPLRRRERELLSPVGEDPLCASRRGEWALGDGTGGWTEG